MSRKNHSDRKVYPLPGLAAPGRGKWTVIEASPGQVPSCNPSTRQMIVPLGDNDLDADSRLHEVAHAVFTDPKKIKALLDRVGPSYKVLVQAAEDARINTSLMNIGAPLRAKVFEDSSVRVGVFPKGEQLAALLATYSTPDEDAIRGSADPDVVDLCDRLISASGIVRERGLVLDQDTAVHLVERMAGLYDDIEPPTLTGPGDGDGDPDSGTEISTGMGSAPSRKTDKEGPVMAGTGKTGSSGSGSSGSSGFSKAPYTAEELNDLEPPAYSAFSREETLAARREDELHSDEDEDYDYEEPSDSVSKADIARDAAALSAALKSATESNDGVQPVPEHHLDVGDKRFGAISPRSSRVQPAYSGWTRLTIVDPPKPMRVPALVRGRRAGVDDTGVVPVALHRASSDGRIFRASRIKPASGTVLIDHSGSMGLTMKDMLSIMEALPASVIADYCSDALEGELRILARKGRMVDRKKLDETIGLCNGCDGPALRWLLRQQGPRFWVCDGAITGKNDGMFHGGGTECVVLCEAGKVIQVRNLRELKTMLHNGTINLRRHPVIRPEDRPKPFVSWR